MDEPSRSCRVCGAETVPGATYCHSCGALVGSQGTTSDGVSAASSSRPALQADPGLERALRGDYNVRIGDWMSRAWTVFTRDGGLFIAFAAIGWLIFWVAAPLLIIFFPLMVSGHLTAALKVRSGERLRFSDFWLPFNDFLPLLLAWLVSAALMFAGLLTCGIVTIYLWVAYQFVYLLILDRRMDFWEALETSRRATSNLNWPALFVFALLMLAVNLVAVFVTFSIGIIVSLPLTSCVLVEAYADIFGVRGGAVARPDPEAASPQPASA